MSLQEFEDSVNKLKAGCDGKFNYYDISKFK
jgi:hypothetical protein